VTHVNRKLILGPALAITALLVATACGSSDDTPPESTATASATPATATATPDADQPITVSAPAGSAASGDVTLAIPKDALPEGVAPSDIKIENITADNLVTLIQDAEVVAAYRLLPDGLVLSEPATVSLQVPVASLSGDLLLLHFTAEGLSPIDDLKVTTDDAGEVATLEATITHFSDLTAIQANFFDIGLNLTEYVYKVGESFPVSVSVHATQRGWGYEELEHGFTTVKAAEPITLSGFWTGKPPALLPNLVEDRPPPSPLAGDYYNTQLFTCEEEARGVSVVYRGSLSYTIEQRYFGDNGRESARGIPGGGATIDIFEQETVDCVTIPPIEAKYDENFTTTYSIDVDPAAGYRFAWSGPNCGSTSGTDQSVMSWVHGDDYNEVCEHAVDDHKDAIISVLVIATDGREWRCNYPGSTTGTGELCEKQE
jgi:hypothetical protein